MGKRSNFRRQLRDFYITPKEAVTPLVPHLDPLVRYMEPCAGDGALIDHLTELLPKSTCYSSFDLEPQRKDILKHDFESLPLFKDLIITNPPWARPFLHNMIERVIESESKAWLLFDADWMHTKQSSQYIKHCQKIVSVGRVKWFGGTTGKDNCAWYLFTSGQAASTEFVGR